MGYSGYYEENPGGVPGRFSGDTFARILGETTISWRFKVVSGAFQGILKGFRQERPRVFHRVRGVFQEC